MPGENPHKLSKSELNQLRKIVRRGYAVEAGVDEKRVKEYYTDRECDKLIDSLLPSTVETLREMGESRGFLNDKKFFLPGKILGLNGKAIMKEDTAK